MVNTVPADGLAPLGAKPSADTVMTTFVCCKCTWPTLETVNLHQLLTFPQPGTSTPLIGRGISILLTEPYRLHSSRTSSRISENTKQVRWGRAYCQAVYCDCLNSSDAEITSFLHQCTHMFFVKHIKKANRYDAFTRCKIEAVLRRYSYIRADSNFGRRQWETSLQSKAVSHWLGANLRLALYSMIQIAKNSSQYLHKEKESSSAIYHKTSPLYSSSSTSSSARTMFIRQRTLVGGPAAWTSFTFNPGTWIWIGACEVKQIQLSRLYKFKIDGIVQGCGISTA